MYADNKILIKAQIDNIFNTASDLTKWPEILPHYRWIRVLEQKGDSSVVNMAAKRGPIPIQWTSEYRVDREKMEMHFHHLKAFTKGMQVVWTFTPQQEGVEVCIKHELESSIPVIGKFISDVIIARFFIHHVANQTLHHMKRFLEAN